MECDWRWSRECFLINLKMDFFFATSWRFSDFLVDEIEISGFVEGDVCVEEDFCVSVSDKKALYPSTIPKMFVRTNLSKKEHTKDHALCFDNTIRQPKESTVYATDGIKFDRSGFKRRERVLVLTTHHLYLLQPHKDGLAKKKVYPLSSVTQITVSSNKDSVAIVSVDGEEAGGGKPARKDDYIFSLPNVIEFVTKFVDTTGQSAVLDIVPSGKRSLMKKGENGSFVQFGVGNVEHIVPVKKSLQVVAQY